MKRQAAIYNSIKNNFLDKYFLKELGLSKKEMQEYIDKGPWKEIAERLSKTESKNGRFNSEVVYSIMKEYLPELEDKPRCGWVKHCYNWVLFQLFPELVTTDESLKFRKGTAYLLHTLRSLYQVERELLPFDPTYTMELVPDCEIQENGFTEEYLRFHRLVQNKYLYEFMRIGVDITPYNTLGHISGVHYIAMFVARQLHKVGVPIDLGLISGAAAGHDIGKYGCKKSEEQRIPYLHYYYTDICYNRFDIGTIGHIAANHSTWDLELENLSVESLVLIYADFRVKSRRSDSGGEIVHFYSLADAFDVILNKLDNVDEAKLKRYKKVYSKLRDFERFMEERGVVTEIPKDYLMDNIGKPKPKERKMVLLNGDDIVDQIKYTAIDHNIRLMSDFHVESKFGNLIEAARSERQWKNLRTYVSILREYSTYMTEKQKLMTLKFLYELLAHKEGDIRSQAASIMGRIIGTFSEEYKKELPVGVTMPLKSVNNLMLWDQYLDKILYPDHKLTEQHKKWISVSLNTFVPSVLKSCKVSCRNNYMDILLAVYKNAQYEEDRTIVLLNTAVRINPGYCDDAFNVGMREFIRRVEEKGSKSVKLLAIECRHHFNLNVESDYFEEINTAMEIPKDKESLDEFLANMFLDDLKTGTSWVVKVANIKIMLKYANENLDQSYLLHVATHLANLLKVSETITVRKVAGNGLLSIIERLPLEQRNELTVELFNGLEIGDYQFSKYIPDYLGIIMLYLPPKELDESIDALKNVMESGNEKAASSVINTIGVMIENYSMYKNRFLETIEGNKKRKYRLINLIIKGFAGFDKVTNQEAFWAIGVTIFGSKKMSMEEKAEMFRHCYKKIITILIEKDERELDFYNNAAVLNHIYRYVSQHQEDYGDFGFKPVGKVAFFPGTYDPFSLGHKAVATKIRDMGFEVFLALDEFSWSKNTQPRQHRRRIMIMSIAGEDDIYVFPEDIPINIANPKDVKKLKDTFAGKDLYIAVGTDVIKNASCYKALPEENSIHTVNHIAFARESKEQSKESMIPKETGYPITGNVINLTLKKYYEDISSTRIRENIDLNRDISNLIDTVAQNYIYKNNLYLREPAYKHVIQAKEINISTYEKRSGEDFINLKEEMNKRGVDFDTFAKYLDRDKVRTIYIESGMRNRKIAAFAAAHPVETNGLLAEFGNPQIAAHIRNKASGGIAVIGAMYVSKGRTISNVNQILLTELLTELLAKDFAYVVFNPVDSLSNNGKTIEALKKQGFVNIAGPHSSNPIYAVDMKSPVILFRDVETVIKNPLNKNPRVLKAVDDAHDRLLRVLTGIYPGQLVLSFNTSAVHNKIISKVAALNGVDTNPDKTGKKGPYMSVPFGKALADVVVPNTVTKALHTEKYFENDLKNFTIAELKYYSKLENQAKTIKSFNRPIILIDDLLHKGYRMNNLDPILKKNKVEVKEIIVGVLTGNARDLMEVRGRSVEGAYLLPNLKLWLNERDSYPFIGGDSVKDAEGASVNLIMPYTVPGFISDGDFKSIYEYSFACLQNARDILKTLENEYQTTFEKKLTLSRLGEVITYPRRPDVGNGISYDENLAPSIYVENDIERLKRLIKPGI